MPQYSLHVSISPTADGKSSVTGQLTRTGVPEDWKDVLPIYAHLGDRIVRMGALAATHPTEQINFVVGGKLDKLTMNESEDLLGTLKQ
jgi:hypothetical protein